MSEGEQKRSLGLPIRKIATTLVSLIVLFVLWRLGLKWWTIPVVVLMAFYYLVLPRLVRSRIRRFNREALLLLGTGKPGEIPKLIRRSFVLQLFGPRGPIDAKLAMAYAAQDRYTRAIPCFRSAISSVEEAEKPALVAGLAKAYFVTGDLDRARIDGAALLKSGTRLPELLAIVARSRIGLGRIDDETKNLLDEADRLSPSAEVRLMIDLSRIEMNLLTGRKPGEMPQNADSPQRFLRAWIHLVRGLLREHRGDGESAKKSFQKALKEDVYQGFVAAAARAHLDPQNRPVRDQVERDPAVQRKKRKGR